MQNGVFIYFFFDWHILWSVLQFRNGRRPNPFVALRVSLETRFDIVFAVGKALIDKYPNDFVL